MIKYGFPSLDKSFGGMNPGDVIVVSGRRGSGNVHFGHQLALNAIETGKKVLLYSGDTTPAGNYQNISKQIAVNADLEHKKWSGLTANESANEAIKRWITGKFWILDYEYSIDEVMSYSKEKCDVLVLDYPFAKRLEDTFTNDYIVEKMKEIKKFAVDNNIVVIIAKNQIPKMNGAYANDAYDVLYEDAADVFISMADPFEDRKMIFNDKQGVEHAVRLEFDIERCVFWEKDRSEAPAYSYKCA